MGATETAEGLDVDALDAAIRGDVIGPDDDTYDEARTVWNARYDKYPAAIARVTGVADVIATVDFARKHDRRVAVRGGGHSYAGHGTCDDGIVVDCTAMNEVRVDPDAKTVRVGPGATWADIDHETQAFGLATTGPTVSSVGAAGFALGGGTGHLVRSLGVGSDNLIGADVVTAAGELVHVSEDENPELLWALRGGGANFGVVTSLEFALHEVGPDVLAGQIIYSIEDAPTVLRAYRDFMLDAPRAVNCYAFLIPIPPLDVFPEELHGETALDLVPCHSGPLEQAESDLAPLSTFAEPIMDAVLPQPYVELQQAFDAGTPKGNRWHSKAQYLSGLPDEAIDAFLEAANPVEGPFSMVYFEPLGGAVGEVAPDATAFPHRDAPFSVHALGGWVDPENDEELTQWVEGVHDAMTPYSTGGVYVNLLHRDEPDRIPEAYGENLERLAALKAEWDPENRFRVNQNIQPATGQ